MCFSKPLDFWAKITDPAVADRSSFILFHGCCGGSEVGTLGSPGLIRKGLSRAGSYTQVNEYPSEFIPLYCRISTADQIKLCKLQISHSSLDGSYAKSHEPQSYLLEEVRDMFGSFPVE